MRTVHGLLVSILSALMLLSCLEHPVSPLQGDAGLGDAGLGDDGGASISLTAQALETSLCGSTSGLQTGSPWPMRGGCPSHAAQSSEYGSLINSKNWSTYLFGNVSSSPIVLADGSIVVGSDAGKLFKINPTTGAIDKFVFLWAAVNSSPAVAANGTLYVGSDIGKVSAIDSITFSVKWSYATLGAVTSSPAVGADGTVYVGSQDSYLYALNATGTKKWSYKTGWAITSSPAVGADGTVYVGSQDGYLYALTSTGGLKWKTKLAGAVDATPALGRFGRVYVSSANKVYALDAATGVIAWQKAPSPTSCTAFSPAVGANGTIYVGTSFSLLAGGTLFALTPDGDVLWELDTWGGIESTPVIDKVGNVFFGSNDDQLYAVDGAGQLLWKYQTLGNIEGSPAIGKGGAVVFGSNDNQLYSIGRGVPKVAVGGVCASDGECQPGLVCGKANGARFGLSATSNACWVPACENKIQDPGEQELNCGGPCGACSGVCSQACSMGTQVLPPAVEVLRFADGAFSRGSVATYQSSASRVEVARGQELRFEDRGDGNGRLALFEGARENLLLWSEQLTHSPEWFQPPGGTPFTVTNDYAQSPTGLPSSERFVASTGAYPSRTQRLWDGTPVGVLSAWTRLTDPASYSAQTPAKTRAVLVDTLGHWYSSPTVWTLPQAWERRSTQTTAATCAVDLGLSHKGGWPGSSTDFPQLSTADFLLWGLQLEAGSFASSYIPTTDDRASRNVDRLAYEPEKVPAWLKSGLWQIDVAPIFGSTEIAVGEQFTLVAWQGGQLALTRDAAGGVLSITSGATTAKRSIAWMAGTKLTLTVDTAHQTLEVRGATSGGGSFSFIGSSIPTGRLTLGALLDGSKPAFARLSEIRKVSAATVACTSDPDCVRCGDGFVTGTEACDPGTDPRCDSECSVRGGLTDCDPSSTAPDHLTCKAPGQGCPPDPNGSSFGAAEWRHFCVPTICIPDLGTSCSVFRSSCADVCQPPRVDCSAKSCGASLDDGAGGICPGVCGRGAPASNEIECAPGLCLGNDVTWRYNPSLPRGQAGCWPCSCNDDDPRRIDCGSTDAECGLCDPTVSTTNYLGALGDKGRSAPPSGKHENEIGVWVDDQVNVPVLDDVSTAALGALPGTFSVTPQGGASYAVAIQVAPGRGGLTPDFALTYDSKSGNSMVGLGWSVSGFSSITICSGTIAQDGVLDSSLKFCLDGQRLIPYAHDDERDETLWHAELDPSLKITSPGDHLLAVEALVSEDGSIPNAFGLRVTPPSFEVISKSGRVMTYGDSEDAQLLGTALTVLDPASAPRQWAISSVRDPAGNSILFKYSKFQDKTKHYDTELVPRWVGYNHHHGQEDSINELVFEYDETSKSSAACKEQSGRPDRCPRPDMLRGWAFNSPVAQTHRLNAIRIMAQGKKVRTYTLVNKTSTNDLTLVSDIIECAFGPTGAKACRPPTRFYYADGPAIPSTIRLPGGRADNEAQRLSLDWNGDGYDDLAVYWDGWTIYPGSPSGIRSPAIAVLKPTNRRDVRAPNGAYLSQAFATDLDADGKTDFLIATNDEDSNPTYERFEYGGSSQPSRVAFPMPDDAWTDDSLVPFDPNGDGLTDFLYCAASGNGSWRVFVNQGNGEFSSEPIAYWHDETDPDDRPAGFCDDARVLGFPDGHEMIVTSVGRYRPRFVTVTLDQRGFEFWMNELPDISETPESHRLLAAPDVNGDGLQDLILLAKPDDGSSNEPRVSRLYLNRGPMPYNTNTEVGWEPAGSAMFPAEAVTRANDVQIADLDRDSRQDLLVRTIVGGSYRWRAYWGSALSAEPSDLSWLPGTASQLTFLDANGDGARDIAVDDSVFLGDPSPSNLLKVVQVFAHERAIPDELEIAYAAGVSPDVYDPLAGHRDGIGGSCEASESYCLARLPGPVVQRYSRKTYVQLRGGVVSQESEESYKYSQAVIDRHGRGFVGFAERHIESAGLGGVELSSTTELYDVSPTIEDSSGPFAKVRPELADPSSYYHYVYYPFSGRPKHVHTEAPLPPNPIAVFLSGTTLHAIDNLQELKTGPGGQRFAVISQVVERDLEIDQTISEQQTLFEYDAYANLKASAMQWPDEPAYDESTELHYAHETHPELVQRWQVALLDGVNRRDEGPGSAGHESTRSSWMSLSYSDDGLLHTYEVGAGEGLESEGLLVTTLGRDEWGNVATVTEERSAHFSHPPGVIPQRVWSIQYDGPGAYPAETQNPEGHVEHFATSYADGLTRTYTDPNGVVTTRKFDGFGRLKYEKNEDTAIARTLEYSAADASFDQGLTLNGVLSALETLTAPGAPAITKTTVYDPRGRLVATKGLGFDPGTELDAGYQYDTLGRLVGATRPHLVGDQSQGAIAFEYDTLGRPIVRRTADGLETSIRYASSKSLRPDLRDRFLSDPSARWIEIVTPPGGTGRGTVRDARGRVVLSSEGDTTTSYAYGAAGFLRKITDPVGNETTYSADVFGRVASSVDPDTGSHHYFYDAWGDVVKHEHNSETHSLQYDLLGRRIRLENGDGITTWTWDELHDASGALLERRLGMLMQQTSPKGHVESYSYQGPGGALSETRRNIQTTLGEIALSSQVTYDSFLRLSQVVYPGETRLAVRYDYAPNGQLDRVENVDDPSEVFWKLESAYEGMRPESMRFGDGAQEFIEYYPKNGLLHRHTVTDSAGAALLYNELGYDENYNIAELTRQSVQGRETLGYTYDDLDRLKTVESTRDSITTTLADLTYTATGNIKTKSGLGTYNYGLTGESDDGPQTMPHAVRSVTSSDGAHAYEYDAFGRMEERSGPSIAGGIQTYTYNALGLVRQVVQDGRTTALEYDAGGSRAMLSDSNGAVSVYFGSLYERRMEGGTTTETLRVLVEGGVIAEIAGTNGERVSTTYVHKNFLGSPEVLTSGVNGSVVERRSYDAFGQREGGASSVSRVSFTGHRDDGLGLIDMKSRWYDPALGRFLSPDPTIPEPLSSQAYDRYGYVRNNPLKFVDPTGLGWCFWSLFGGSCDDSNGGGSSSGDGSGPSDEQVYGYGGSDPTIDDGHNIPNADMSRNPDGSCAAGYACPGDPQVSSSGSHYVPPNDHGLGFRATAVRAGDASPTPLAGTGSGGAGTQGPGSVPYALSGWFQGYVSTNNLLDAFASDPWGGATLFNASALGATINNLEAAFTADPVRFLASATNPCTGSDIACGAPPLLPGAVFEAGAVARAAGASRLVGANRAIIDPRKLTEYALNPAHPVGGNKARVFESALGYTQKNFEGLLDQIRAGVMNHTPTAGRVDAFGARFTVDIPVTGPAGSATVRTGWIYKTGSNTPELTTLFVH